MAWGKIDDRLHSTRKWRRASKNARALWTTALSWCMSELTDGNVPRDMLAVLDGKPADAKSLVEAGLWHETDDGWEFHDWLDYQPSRESVMADRAAAAERQRVARERAREKRQAQGVTGDVTAKSQRESRRESQGQSRSPRPDPTRPDPISSSGETSSGGGSKRRASNDDHPIQRCGKAHDPDRACRGCADARRRDDEARVEAQRAKSKADRDAQAAERDRRRAEEARIAAEAAADPEAIETARQQALAAARAARNEEEA